jgi:hypothetical protein
MSVKNVQQPGKRVFVLVTVIVVLMAGVLIGAVSLYGAMSTGLPALPTALASPQLVPAITGTVYLPIVTAGSSAPQLGGCNVFPADNIWNTPIDTLPLDANSEAYVSTIGANSQLHPDFGAFWEGAPIGIPFIIVPSNEPLMPITFVAYGDQSDPGPYPIPQSAPIEGGSGSDGDRHVLAIRQGECKLYELYRAFPVGGGWEADSGAVFDLTVNGPLRPDGWTSADAAGLPILPGLVRYDEVMVEGEIRHAVRFTALQTRRAYVWPARHYASSLTGLQYPPMGQRFRLKASFDISGYSPQIQVILRALKKYGMILADNGSAWYISGQHDPRWDDDLLGELKQLHGSDFEAVDVSSLMIDPNSGQAGTPPGAR